MVIGYARVSSANQNLARQIEALDKAGVEKIFQEKISGKNIKDRIQFQKMMKFIREGDTLVVESLERLGRNQDEILNIISTLDKNDINLKVLNLPALNTDIGDPNLQKLIRSIIIQILSWTAQQEREEIRRKQQQGISIAKANGVYKGTKPQYSDTAKDPKKKFIYKKIIEMLDEGIPIKRIAEETGTNRMLVYRIIKRNK